MIMDIKDFTEMIKRKRDRLDSMMRRKMPVMVGRMAKDREVPMPPAIMVRCSPAGSIFSNRSDIHLQTTG